MDKFYEEDNAYACSVTYFFFCSLSVHFHSGDCTAFPSKGEWFGERIGRERNGYFVYLYFFSLYLINQSLVYLYLIALDFPTSDYPVSENPISGCPVSDFPISDRFGWGSLEKLA